ncbi:MAG: sulfatase-like hydrolase/transferase [Deltaproteobacteria bacterium]|nr:sulfatase-like hydrolase/transferase [Deltaproteobacteria bacterium]
MRSITAWIQTLLQFAGRFTLAGLALAMLETALCCIDTRRPSLSFDEIWYNCFFILSATVTVCLICASFAALVLYVAQIPGGRVAASRLSYRVAMVAALAAAPIAALVLWLLTQGRRVRDLPGRSLVVFIAALLLGLCAFWLTRLLIELGRQNAARQRVLTALSLWLIVISCLVVDAWVLRRLYPAFHWTMAAISILSATSAVAVMPFSKVITSGFRRVTGVAGLSLIASAPFAAARLLETPHGGTAIEQAAPVSGKLFALASRFLPSTRERPAARLEHRVKKPVAVSQNQPGIDLRNHDVLLISVDALRADRLSAYGGSGVAPNIDGLSRESAVFLRAYTPTPHTSYALASMLTGKFLKVVMELFPGIRLHQTLPSLLRRYGYLTAAFYPPAVFYIDEERFNPFRTNHFGFEHQKETFAPASDLVRQVIAFLEQADSSRPWFVWVHIFEPHEPYEPPEPFLRGTSPVERYDGEVAAADDAVGKLIKAFRAAKPDSIVVLTADHGEEFDEHGGFYHGTTLYDEQVRVPFIWSIPSAIKPRAIQAPVETVDLAVTLLSVLGIPRDAAMQGDDLSPLLLGADAGSELVAFSEINAMKMVCDGRYKAICSVGAHPCRVFDLLIDPGETRSIGGEQPEIALRLRESLAQFIGSIVKRQVASARDDQARSEIFSRAKLGDPMVGPDLVPLLGSQRAEVRSRAARYCGSLEYLPAAPIVRRLRLEDEDEAVRAECAIAAVCFGDEIARGQVEELLSPIKSASDETFIDRSRRAALCLAKAGSRAGARVLIDLAQDRSAARVMRKRAISALGAIREKRAVETLIHLLSDDFLRVEIADALGDMGGRAAANALVQALRKEPYLAARQAEARALVRLKDQRVKRLIRRYLATESSLPGGVDMLLSIGALARASGRGADLRRSENVRIGAWDCSQEGCLPQSNAAIRLPPARAPEGPARAVFKLRAQSASDTLRIEDKTARLRAGEQEVGVSLPAVRGSREMSVAGSSGVRLIAVAVVAEQGVDGD